MMESVEPLRLAQGGGGACSAVARGCLRWAIPALSAACLVLTGNPANEYPPSINWQKHSMKHQRRIQCERAKPDIIHVFDRFLLAEGHGQLGRLDEAEKVFEEIDTFAPEMNVLARFREMTLRQLQREKEARQMADRVSELEGIYRKH
jgi:hypothetical protein